MMLKDSIFFILEIYMFIKLKTKLIKSILNLSVKLCKMSIILAWIFISSVKKKNYEMRSLPQHVRKMCDA